ncbi:MAG TPA: PAS domain S-box protein [Anaerolineales bacterium]
MSDPTRVLIVEDLAADAELAKREIWKVIKDCEFHCVESHKAYLQALKTFQPDLILSDYHLPHFDGMRALRLALEHSPLTPLIIWTGSLSEDIAVDCMKAGANNYIIKENLQRLGPAVIHALEERRLLLERKQAEEKYRAIFENSPEGIFQSTPEGRFISLNPAMARIYGYDAPQEMIDSITDIAQQLYLDPAKREFFTRPLETFGVIENFECENKRKDGSVMWTSTSARVVRDDDGNVLYYEGFLQDITQPKQAEQALENSEKRFRALIENGLDNISLLAADGSLIWESPAVFRTLDYAPDQFLGQDIFKLMHPDDLDWTRDLFTKLVQEAGSRQHGIFRLQHSSGTWRWVEAIVTNMLDEPSVNAIVVNYRDITERKQAEETLRRNEAILAQAERMAHLGAWEIEYSNHQGLNNVPLRWSEEVYRIFGYEPGEIAVTNDLFFKHVHPDDRQRIDRAISQAIAEKEPYEIEHRIIRPDGTERTLLEHAHITLNEQGQPLRMLGAVQDITERKRAEAHISELLVFNEKILNNSPIGILTYKLTGECVFANGNAASIIGTNVESLVAQNFYLIESWKESGLYGLVEKAISSGDPVTSEIHHLSSFGKDLWLTAYAATFRSKDEDHLLLTISDITERKQAEMQRQALLEIMQGLANAKDLQEFLKLIHHSIGRVIYAENFFVVLHDDNNGLFEEIYSVDQYDPPEPPSKLEKSITSYVFRTSKPLLLTDSRFNEMVAQGEVELVGTNSASWLGVPLKTSGGTIGVIAVQDYENPDRYTERDKGFLASIAAQVALAIERKRAEDELRASEERFTQLANNIQEVFWMTDAETDKQLYISPAAEAIWGRPLEYLMNEPDAFINSILLEDQSIITSRLNNQKSGRKTETEYRIVRPDESVRWIWDRAFPILDDSGRVKRIAGVSADITEHKQAEEESRRRAEETSALLETSLALTNLDLQTTLQTIGSSAKTLFAADGCRIFLMEPDGESLRCVLALQENSMAFSDLRIKIGDGVTGAVAASGQAEIVNKMQNDPRGVQVSGTPVEEEAIMFAPLKERDRAIGVLSIRRVGTERPFQSPDLELLEAFAAMAASAVSNARLFEETQRRLAELEALYENGLAVGRLLDPNEIGDRIIETFARYLSWHHVAIRLKRPESDELELIALNQPGLSEQERGEMERHFSSMISKVDQGLSGWVIQTGEAIRTGNVHSHPQYVDTQEGIQSGLYMPLKIGERIIGSISVESEMPDAFSSQDERLLATLANQAAIAFENARLYQSIQQELTERKRLQKQLDREHAQLKALFETIPDPIWLKDPQGKYLACNRVLEELIDVHEEQILGKTDYELLDETLAGHFKEKDQEAIERNVPMTYQEWVTYPNKQPRLLEAVRTPMHDDRGSLIGVLGISHDITAMYNTQQELRESQELYRLLVETSPDGIGIFGLDGTIIFANQQLADLFGMKGPFDCIGMNFLSLIAPGQQPRIMELVEEAVPDGVVLEEYWMVRKNGSRFYGEARSSLSLDKTGQPRWIIGQIRDITESKTARETIQEERQRFVDLFENAPVAIWLEDFSQVMAWMEQLRIKGVTDLKAYLARHPEQFKFALGLIRILSVNQAAVEMNGAHSKAHLLERFHQLVRDEVPSGVMMHELEMLWNGITSFEFEMTSRKLDETLITGILHVYVPINNEKPDYTRVIIASTDISERVNTEKALQASETHYRELADSITDIFFEMDHDLHYIYWNKASENLTGIPSKDAIGKSMREIFGDSEEQARIEKIYEDVLTNHQSKTFETILTLENRQHIFEINAYPSTRGVSVVAKDVTDRKKSETIMQKRFELMEYSAHHSLDELMQKTIDEVSQLTGSTIGFMHFVKSDQITLGMQTWSTSALQQFNVPVSEGTHRPLDQAGVWADPVRERRSVIHNDYASLPNRKGLPEGHAPVIREMVIPIIRNEKTVAVLGLGNRPKDYTQRDLEIAERFADYAWDITERKQMEMALADERNQLAKRVEERAADLIRANTNLARALRVKDEFLANMSHELRTPLNAILGLSESLGEQIAGPLNEKQQKYITTISESGRHLLALINDILDLAKIEAGQITLDINRVDIQSVCEASLRMIRQLAQKKRQDVTLQIDDDIGLIWADERRLKQMIVNLLSNAVKFTPEDGKIGLEVHGNEMDNEVMITVWDNGIGMREEDLSRLFQPFVQLDSGLARETTGTGLGLALVAQMVRLHGGSVRVESHPEQGSRFTIVLPWEPALAVDPAAKMKITGKFRVIRPDPNDRPTILLIEDTNEVIMMIRDYLELAGYDVATAKDGVEGITQAQLIHPDLILMDVMMPRMDGLEATRRLRSEPDFAETPIIALTALAMPSDRERCISAGMNDYMSKPINLKELVKTIQRFLVSAEEASS